MQAIAARAGRLFVACHNYGSEDPLTRSQYSPNEILEHYCRKSIFGEFRFSPALRPDILKPMVPREGFIVAAPGPEADEQDLCVQCAVDSDRLLDVFFSLVGLLPEDISMVSEELAEGGKPQSFQNDRVEKVVAVSRMLDFEDVLLGDGFSGVGFFSDETDEEVFLDEHRLIYIYAQDNGKFLRALREFGLRELRRAAFISEHAHMHFRAARLAERHAELKRAFLLEPCSVMDS